MLVKETSRSCPKCGELYEECQIAKVGLGVGVHVNLRCPNNHKWTEFYSLVYRGYWSNHVMYDSYGEECSKNKEEVAEGNS